METPAHVCIARHGETDWNAAGILQGWIDIPLNDGGRHRAREMAAAFADAGFAAIWSSPLSRALETAEIIAHALRLPPPLRHDGLKERNFGAIQGIPKLEVGESNAILLQQILRRNPATVFDGGETMDEFAERVLGAIMEIGAAHGGERVLVIIHGWAMDVITRQIQGLPRNAILGFKRKHGTNLWLEATATAVRRLP